MFSNDYFSLMSPTTKSYYNFNAENKYNLLKSYWKALPVLF